MLADGIFGSGKKQPHKRFKSTQGIPFRGQNEPKEFFNTNLSKMPWNDGAGPINGVQIRKIYFEC
jgi:hypothetical protein